MEVGSNWPFPPQWGRPTLSKPVHLLRDEQIEAEVRRWALRKIRAARPLSGMDAMRELDTRLTNDARLLRLDVLERQAP